MSTETSFKSLALKRYPVVQERETAEGRYWRKFKKPTVIKYSTPCTSLHFNPVAPFDLALSSSLSVVLLDVKAQTAKKTLSRFNDVAYSARFRNDGRLVAAGGEEGVVRTFEAASGSSLRQLRGHSAPVHAVRWTLDGLSLLSASDDKSLRAWDVPTAECLWTKSGAHDDHVRALAVSPNNVSTFASGGYDHSVKLWDARDRSARSVFTVDHGDPVEDLLFLPGGSLLLSCGGNNIKVWDLLGGGRAVHTMSSHQKVVTSMCLDSTKSRLLSAGLDGHVKVYSLNNYAVTHGFKYNAPVLSLAISPDNTQLVVGTSDGELTTRTRELKAKGPAKQKASLPPERISGGTAKFFERGKNVKAPVEASKNGLSEDASSALHQRKQRLRPFDAALRKYRYHEALDAALASRNPTVVVTVLEELVYRAGLLKALAGRDEVTLEPLLSFLARYTTNPRFAPLLVDVGSAVFETYKAVLGQSEAIDELFTKLGRQVKLEIGFQQDLLGLLGTMDAVMSAPAASGEKA